MRIIFIDIDGPLIPSGCFFIDKNAAANRVFSQIAISILNHLAIAANAKIVTNSSHNFLPHAATLKEALIDAGINEKLFHKNWRTTYGSSTGWDSRYNTIQDWIAGNLGTDEECEWVCFDDFEFTTDERLILIDYDVGITPKDYIKALDRFNIKHSGLIANLL